MRYRPDVKYVLVLLAACSSAPAAPAPPPQISPVARSPRPEPPLPAPVSFTVSVSGSGRPVILIPGLGCPGSVWDGTVAHLHAQTHVVTLAGFAGQPAIDAPVVAAARVELARYIRDRHLDHPVVIGHSLGGLIAYELAADAPDVVGPTIVVDELPVLDTRSEPAAIRRTTGQLRDHILAETEAQFVQETREMFGGMSTHPRQLAPVIDAVVTSDRRAFAGAFYDVFTSDVRPVLGNIRAPVLVVLAADTPAELAESELAALPGHELRVVPNTRHFVMLDDPGAFFAAVDTFLAAHPSP